MSETERVEAGSEKIIRVVNSFVLLLSFMVNLIVISF